MLLKVTEIEKEILRCAGEVKETGVEGEVCFDLPYGVDLPDPVLEKIYHLNAERVFQQFKGGVKGGAQ